MDYSIFIDSIQTTLNSFDFSFCIAVNVLTYIIIKIIDDLNGDKSVSTWGKRIALLISVSLVSVIYYNIGIDLKLLTNSVILAPVFWSWVIKPICKLLKIDYKHIN